MQKSFCRNILCNKQNRTNRCCACKVFMCNLCTINSMVKPKLTYCINCYLKTFSPDWKKLNKEFDEMLKLEPIEIRDVTNEKNN